MGYDILIGKITDWLWVKGLWSVILLFFLGGPVVFSKKVFWINFGCFSLMEKLITLAVFITLIAALHLTLRFLVVRKRHYDPTNFSDRVERDVVFIRNYVRKSILEKNHHRMKYTLETAKADLAKVPIGFGRDEFLILLTRMESYIGVSEERNPHLTDAERMSVIGRQEFALNTLNEALSDFESITEWTKR